MAAAFDFEKYYTIEKVQTETTIDRSGVDLQNPTETSEVVTDNVVYYFADIAVSYPDGSSEWIGNTDRRILVRREDIASAESYYVRPWHPVGDLAGTGVDISWETLDGKRMGTYVAGPGTDFAYYLIDDSKEDWMVPVSSFAAFVFPRHEAESGRVEPVDDQIREGVPVKDIDQSVVTDPATMKLLYGALGFYGGRWKGNKWLEKWVKKPVSKLGNPVIAYDTFRKRIAEISDLCADSGIGINVTYYDTSFGTEDDDVTATGLSRKTTFQEAYSVNLPNFLRVHEDIISEVRGATSTALIPPVKEAVRAFFYPVDELEAEFEDLFVDTMQAISDVPVLWRFVSGSNKGKLKEAAGRYIRKEVDPVTANRMAFDMEIILNALAKHDTPADGIKQNPMPAFCAYPRLVQLGPGDERGTSWIVGQPYDMRTKIGLAMWPTTDSFATGVYRDYSVGESPFAGAGEDARFDIKKHRRMSEDEVDRILVEYYQYAYAMSNDWYPELVSMDYVKRLKKGELGEYEHVGSFDTYYWNISLFMNTMRAAGGDDGSDDKGQGMSSTLILDRYFAEGKQYSAHSPFIPDYSDRKNMVLHGYYDILSWGDCSVPDAIKYDEFVADYMTDWKDLSSTPSVGIGYAVDVVGVMKDIYDEMSTAVTVFSVIIGPVLGALAQSALNDIEESIDRLDDIAKQMLWYQRYVKEAPFSNYSMIPDDRKGEFDTRLPTWTMPARLMFPVSMYNKVRVKYKNFFGLTRHRTVKKSIGVRWAEVTFYDTNVYSQYPQVTETPGEDIPLDGTSTIDNNTITLDYPLPATAVGRDGAVLVVKDGYGTECRFDVTVSSDIVLRVDGWTGSPGPYALLKLRLPLAPAQPEIAKEKVNVMYEMPSLPYDSELRKKAFQDYGPFSHAEYFAETRYSTEPEPADVQAALDADRENHKDGWVVFHDTSDDIKDLREGLGIHDKVAMLLSILSSEFGSNRVKLVETYRSMDDQIPLCSGGPESYFLSWHNYGLAARILILQADGKTPITKDGPEAKRMIPIAKAFTECCANGDIGNPCNVVWCARLAVGPSVFDWEFLPIGVGHKDAPKFREATISQMDPVREIGYVDVDSAGYVCRTKPDDNRPYVLSDSPRYQNALVIKGRHYMPPDSIKNYEHIDDIVLFDVKEYINLVTLKMNAHGTAKPLSGSIYDWKAANPDSAAQLVRYYAMTGNIPSAKAILAGDFVEKYGPVDDQYYNVDPVEYLRGMLGSHYYDARITVPRDGESAYITLHDGIYHVKSMEAYPDNPPTRLDTHKQQQVDSAHMKWGSWHDGAFYTEDEREIPVIESERPVISGYVSTLDDDGNTVWSPDSDEAIFIHQIVADHVHRKFGEIRKSFENFGGALMYDRIDDSPNSGMVDMLENEFGLIGAQDLIDFDDLERIVGTPEVLEEKVDGSIYEKVVNNAQLSGIRKASLTREHIHIKDTPSKSDAKTLYDLIQKGKGYMANDLLK